MHCPDMLNICIVYDLASNCNWVRPFVGLGCSERVLFCTDSLNPKAQVNADVKASGSPNADAPVETV